MHARGVARECRAQAVVEMAIVTPVLIVLALISCNLMIFAAAGDRRLTSAMHRHTSKIIKRYTVKLEEFIWVVLTTRSRHCDCILHSIYEMSCAHYYPSLADLSAAVNACKVYGLSLKKYVAPGAPLYQSLLAYAPTNPLDIYALAASNDLLDLAITTSSHLLSFQLPTLTDEMAMKIGPVYLKKLFFLHLGRIDAVRNSGSSSDVAYLSII